ncbi:MAG TPA: MXAN_6640 family putative metalloprotease, partial [candidate division Zixibacteria bacterium]|nr:MXAN_6640 family putative metalloprotease [candidate division Zixibacteria bacterium]
MKKSFFLNVILFFSFSIAFGADSDLKTLHENIQKTLTTQPGYFDTAQGKYITTCGTSHFVEFNFVKNQAATDPSKSLGPLFHIPRPSYDPIPEQTYDSPAGYFKIHFVTSGQDSVYQPLADSNPPDGIPDYVNKVAAIFDSVWNFEVNVLGYTPPPSDGWYVDTLNGGDGKYDVYLFNLGSGYFGITAPETTAGPFSTHSYTSYIVIRNDYPAPPFDAVIYNNVRVTAAHEFFHSIQFGYDVFEFEYLPGDSDAVRPYWQELTATWMEDMAYDNINQYRDYLRFFFGYPWLSLRTFRSSSRLADSIKVFHPYASCVWAFYLQERYGPNIIRRIWEECGAVAQFNLFSATDSVLREFTGGDTGFVEAFTEFTIWNYFTGNR